jgi:hypothetical protein
MPVARTPANVPGDFYVAADQCISCGAPEAEAPGLIRFDDVHQSCFFSHQPVDAESTYRAVSAVAVCCAGALRYGGSDPDILRRLARLQLVNQCDVQTPVNRSGPLAVATFADGAHGPDRKDSAMLVATRVARALSAVAPFLRVSAPMRRFWRVGASFGYTWSSIAPGHNVVVRRADDGPGRWRIAITRRGAPVPGHARAIDDALRSLPEVSDRRWYSAADRAGSRHWEAYPL